MSTKQIKILRSLSKDELTSKARELEGIIFQSRMKKVTGQLENTASIWKLRKDLARVKTLGSSTKATK